MSWTSRSIGPSSCGGLRECLVDLGLQMNDRAVQERRGRQAVFPAESPGIDGRQVPKDAVHITTVRRWLVRAGGCNRLRDQLLAIPELPHSRVRDSSHHARVRRREIRRQDRKPHDIHAHIRAFPGGEHRLHCGSPPQTGRSCRRQQHDRAGGVRISVELALELLDGGAIEIDERWLAGRRLATEELPPDRERQDEQECRENCRAPADGTHGSQSAISDATTCGKKTTSSTTVVERRNTTAGSVLLRAQARCPRRSCTNPSASRAKDATTNQPRCSPTTRLTLASAVPAANPTGRQHTSIVRALAAAPPEANESSPLIAECFQLTAALAAAAARSRSPIPN